MHVQFSILHSQTQSLDHVCHYLAALQAFANETGVIFHSQIFIQCLNISTCFVGLTVPPTTHFLSKTSFYLSSWARRNTNLSLLQTSSPPSPPLQSFCHLLLQTSQSTTCLQAPFLTHQAQFPFSPWSRGRGHLVKTQTMNHFLMTRLYLRGGWNDDASHMLKL